MDVEVLGDGALGGREALRDDGAAVDAPRAGRVPEGSGVGEEVWVDFGEVREFEDGFDWRGGRVWWWWGDERRMVRHVGGSLRGNETKEIVYRESDEVCSFESYEMMDETRGGIRPIGRTPA